MASASVAQTKIGVKEWRPFSLGEARRRLIVEAIANGARKKAACNLAGLSYDWVSDKTRQARRFMEQATPEEIEQLTGPLVRWCQLYFEMEQAQAEWEQRQLAVIERAAQSGEWQAAAWNLERRMPEHYTQRRDRAPVDDAEVGAVVEVRALLKDDDARDAVSSVLRQLARPGNALPRGSGGSEDAEDAGEVIFEEDE